MRLCRITKSHFRRRDSRAAPPHGAILLEKLRELCFGYAEVRSAERLPNFLAANVGSGIVTPRLMAKEILESGLCPCSVFLHGLGLHVANREINREKVNINW